MRRKVQIKMETFCQSEESFKIIYAVWIRIWIRSHLSLQITDLDLADGLDRLESAAATRTASESDSDCDDWLSVDCLRFELIAMSLQSETYKIMNK